MASSAAAAAAVASRSGSKSLLDCSKCHQRLNQKAKKLVCLHSFCENCIPKNECPECGEIISDGGEMSSLSEYFLKLLRREKLQSSEYHCGSCEEDGVTSVAKFWCKECQVFLCDNNCDRWHKKFHRNHILVELKEKKEAIDLIIADNNKCSLHEKCRDFYCNYCNMCYCNICYREYHSSECLSMSGPLRVRDEFMRRRHSELPTILKEVEKFEEKLRSSSEIISNSIEELNKDYSLECQKVWVEFEEFMEREKKNAERLCDKIKEKKEEEEKKWLELFKEYEKMSKQIEIWLIHVQLLIEEEEEEEGGVVFGEGDMLCEMKVLISKWSLEKEGKKKKWSMPPPPEIFVKYEVSLPNWWQESMIDPSRNEENKSGGCCIIKEIKQEEMLLIQQKQLNVPPPVSNPEGGREITSILVSHKDGHFFLSDWRNRSILELDKLGKLRNEFFFRYQQNPGFYPLDMCWISPDNFVVCGDGRRSNLLFFERVENPPFLKITKQIQTNKRFYSLCKKNEIIFCCDFNFTIDCFSQNEEQIKTIEFEGPEWTLGFPRLRFDQFGGNFWGSKWDSEEVFCFNSNGEKIDSFKKEENFKDFCFFYGNLFFVSEKGIFSFFQNKCFHKFEKISENYFPVFCIFENKMFVCIEIEGKDLIKIFEIISG